VAHNNVKFMFTGRKGKHFILIVQIFNNIYDCKVRKIMGLLGQKSSKPMDVGLKTFTALDGIHV